MSIEEGSAAGGARGGAAAHTTHKRTTPSEKKNAFCAALYTPNKLSPLSKTLM